MATGGTEKRSMTDYYRYPRLRDFPDRMPPYDEWPDTPRCADADADIFFPLPGENGDEAKKICARCPCLDVCRDWAVTEGEPMGVWGQTTPHERKVLRQKMGLAA